MSMKTRILWLLLLVAAALLIVEFLVLDGLLPSIAQQRSLRKVNDDREVELWLRSLEEITSKSRKTKTKPRVLPRNSFSRQKGEDTESAISKFREDKNLELIMQRQNSAKLKDSAVKERTKKTSNKISDMLKKGQKTKKRMRRPRLVDRKLFLIYTRFFEDFPWKSLSSTSEFTQFKGNPCPVTNCSLSYDKLDFSRSDVVIFHARNMPTWGNMSKLHRRRPRGQIWVYFILENPSHTPDPSYLDGMFNWTMSYERKADIQVPYGSYSALEEGERSAMEPVNPGAKDRLVVWLVSNCGGLRDWYVEKLLNYIRVDIFGNCASNYYQPALEEWDCPRGSWECDNILQRYKFHLSLENGNCVDYVTEKYWGTPLALGIVPVVLGGANYSEIAIPGSYINLFDFPSVKALADYLLYLDKNDTAYMEYFAWRRNYKVNGYLGGSSILNYHYPWTCELCAKAQQPQTKIYHSLSEVRDPSFLCAVNEDNLTDMIFADRGSPVYPTDHGQIWSRRTVEVTYGNNVDSDGMDSVPTEALVGDTNSNILEENSRSLVDDVKASYIEEESHPREGVHKQSGQNDMHSQGEIPVIPIYPGKRGFLRTSEKKVFVGDPEKGAPSRDLDREAPSTALSKKMSPKVKESVQSTGTGKEIPSRALEKNGRMNDLESGPHIRDREKKVPMGSEDRSSKENGGVKIDVQTRAPGKSQGKQVQVTSIVKDIPSNGLGKEVSPVALEEKDHMRSQEHIQRPQKEVRRRTVDARHLEDVSG